MLNAREYENKTEKISGLALALLFDRCFIDLFDLSENNNRKPRRFWVRRSLRGRKHDKRVVGKEIFLERF